MSRTYFNIKGQCCFRTVGGYRVTDFTSISKLYLCNNPFTGTGEYLVCLNMAAEFVLDPENDVNGITVNGMDYYGKDLHRLAMVLEQKELDEVLDKL